MNPDRGGSLAVPVNQPVELGGRTKMQEKADLEITGTEIVEELAPESLM
jgi:hypothetical protein